MHIAAEIFKWGLITVWALVALTAPSRVGKERKPVDAGEATSVLIASCLFIAGMIILWGH
jgi:hypothetical protein